MEYARNKRAGFDYSIEETFEAGIELTGIEVKSVRKGRVSLDGAHVIVRGAEAFALGIRIEPYQPKNTPDDYDPARTRKLLLHTKELLTLAKAEGTKGLTTIVISLYNKGSKIKASIAIAKGKRLHDKRETIKKRETDREIRREIKVR
jgi:SsrA-binding protein